MTPAERIWEVRLSLAAEADLDDILLWTADRFGESQARAYGSIFRQTLLSLRSGPSVAVGAKARPEIAKGLYSIHAGGISRRARHFIFFQVVGDERFEIVRVLHDGMDFPRHLPSDEPGET